MSTPHSVSEAAEGKCYDQLDRKTGTRQIDDEALWVWGRLRAFEERGILDRPIEELTRGMLATMRDDVERLAPAVAAWLARTKDVR